MTNLKTGWNNQLIEDRQEEKEEEVMIQRTKIHGDIFPIPDDKAMAPMETAAAMCRQLAAAAVVVVGAALMASILSKTKV